jgi:aspartate-semialdehyde dehydrogenase
VHVLLRDAATLQQVQAALSGFAGPDVVQRLPTAPAHPILLQDGADRPQPRRDAGLGSGMAISVGRLRLSPDGRGLRLVVLGHNLVRGAAGQSVMNAELAHRLGYLGGSAVRVLVPASATRPRGSPRSSW